MSRSRYGHVRCGTSRRNLALLVVLLASFLVGGRGPQPAQAHNGGIWSVPVLAAAPPMDGSCNYYDPASFGAARRLTIDSGVGVYVERTATDLYFCFTGIDVRNDGPPNVDDAAIVTLDVDHSGGAQVDPKDYQFTIQPTSSSAVRASAFSGTQACTPRCFWGFFGADPGGWSAAGHDGIPAEFLSDWRAELRVSLATLGGDWAHYVGLRLAYENGTGPIVGWPAGSDEFVPSTWTDLDLTGNQPFITAVSPASVSTPQATRPGTTVYIRGYHLCIGSNLPRVLFGFRYTDPASPVATTADACTPGASGAGDLVQVRVPRYAVSGNVQVYTSTANAISTDALVVDSYRYPNGFQFENYNGPNLDFNEYRDLYGDDQMMFQIDPCEAISFGFLHCPIPTPIPSLYAALFYGISKGVYDGKGVCFGLALGSQRFIRGEKPLSAFSPPGATAVYGLDGRNGPSPNLQRYLETQHLAQASVEYLYAYLRGAKNNTLASDPAARVYGELQSHLTQNPPDRELVAIRHGTDGHVLVAYDVEGTPDNYTIWVYDPNQEFRSSELADSVSHQQRVDNSSIQVSGNHWSFAGLNWSGDLSSLVLASPSVVPVSHPTLPQISDVINGLVVILGDAQTTQLSDAAGHRLLNPDGSTNLDPASRFVDATRFPNLGGGGGTDALIIGAGGPVTHTVVGTATGVYSDTLFAPKLAASVQQVPAAAGISDNVTLDGGASRLTFSSGAAQKPFTAQLIGKAGDLSEHSATVESTGFAKGDDTITFDAGRQHFSYRHNGPATSFALTLAWVGPKGMPATYHSPKLAIGSGDTITFTPVDWRNLLGGPVMMTTTHADGTSEAPAPVPSPVARLIGCPYTGSGVISFVATIPAAPGRTLSRLEASSTPRGPWQVVAPLGGSGPATVSGQFDVTSGQYGGSGDAGQKTVYLATVDTAGTRTALGELGTTYAPGAACPSHVFLPLIHR